MSVPHNKLTFLWEIWSWVLKSPEIDSSLLSTLNLNLTWREDLMYWAAERKKNWFSFFLFFKYIISPRMRNIVLASNLLYLAPIRDKSSKHKWFCFLRFKICSTFVSKLAKTFRKIHGSVLSARIETLFAINFVLRMLLFLPPESVTVQTAANEASVISFQNINLPIKAEANN